LILICVSPWYLTSQSHPIRVILQFLKICMLNMLVRTNCWVRTVTSCAPKRDWRLYHQIKIRIQANKLQHHTSKCSGENLISHATQRIWNLLQGRNSILFARIVQGSSSISYWLMDAKGMKSPFASIVSSNISFDLVQGRKLWIDRINSWNLLFFFWFW